MRVLGIDPGTHKCGLAVVAAGDLRPLERRIVAAAELAASVRRLAEAYAVGAIALGSGTRGDAVARELAALGFEVTIVDERATTLEARARYFAAKPPRGWRRFVPRGMLVPPEPIDDFAAVLIAERFLAERPLVEPPPSPGG